jgi:hypothetical protein
MASFGKADPAAKLARDLESKIAERRKNAERLATAEAKLAAARARVENSAFEGDERPLDSAVDAEIRAERTVQALRNAGASIESDISKIEHEIARIEDQRKRAETSKQIEELIGRWEAVAAAFLDAGAAFAAVSREVEPLVIGAMGTTRFLSESLEQIPPASDLIVSLLRGRAIGVLSAGPVEMPRPQAPPPKLTLVEGPKLEEVFFIRSARYRDPETGKQIFLCQNYRHQLPQHLAAKALKVHAAISTKEARASGLDMVGTGYILPDPRRCIALDDSPLDAAPPVTAAEPMKSTAGLFEPLDRGRPYSFVAPVSPAAGPIPATRSAPTEEH